MTQGIYLITNTVNNRHYIGQSKDIEARWGEHRRTATSDTNVRASYPLYRAFNKYGIDKFTFEILEVVPNHSELNTVENKYIAQYNSIANGYNQIITSHNGLSKEDLNKKREEQYGVTKDKLEAQLLESNFETVARHYGVASNTIRKWCKDFDLPTSAKAYDSPAKQQAFSERMRSIAIESSTTCKRVAMLDKTSWRVLKEFSSTRDAAEYLDKPQRNIIRAIYGYEGRKTAYGYRWAYIK